MKLIDDPKEHAGQKIYANASLMLIDILERCSHSESEVIKAKRKELCDTIRVALADLILVVERNDFDEKVKYDSLMVQCSEILEDLTSEGMM